MIPATATATAQLGEHAADAVARGGVLHGRRRSRLIARIKARFAASGVDE